MFVPQLQVLLMLPLVTHTTGMGMIMAQVELTHSLQQMQKDVILQLY